MKKQYQILFMLAIGSICNYSHASFETWDKAIARAKSFSSRDPEKACTINESTGRYEFGFNRENAEKRYEEIINNKTLNRGEGFSLTLPDENPTIESTTILNTDPAKKVTDITVVVLEERDGKYSIWKKEKHLKYPNPTTWENLMAWLSDKNS